MTCIRPTYVVLFPLPSSNVRPQIGGQTMPSDLFDAPVDEILDLDIEDTDEFESLIRLSSRYCRANGAAFDPYD